MFETFRKNLSCPPMGFFIGMGVSLIPCGIYLWINCINPIPNPFEMIVGALIFSAGVFLLSIPFWMKGRFTDE